ncbi:neuroblastoma breakpoint family member 3-like [Cebus imitator]|uniref:neuroblastoma breakpoint family member 3-like n=1 Tax=Cebus imitator TaxID=2715852 RepID=UPI0018995DDE|nr:neuroblastoma breakpoint family member 3-like [Cebus imitator]
MMKNRNAETAKINFLMSQVAYYLGCWLKTEVPGYLCSAPNVSTVGSDRPPSRKNTEVNVSECIEKSCSQQEENKPNFRASKNRLLMSQVAYFLNYRLKTYKDRKEHEEEQKCRDSKNKLLITQVAYYLGCRLKTEEDRKDHEKEQKYRDSKNTLLMSQAAHDLGCRLTTEENNKGEDEDVHVVEAEKIQESRAPRNLQESMEEEAPQESWDEGYPTLSIPPGTSAFSESYRSNLHKLEEQQVNLAVDIGKIKKDQEEKEDRGPLCPRLSMELVEAEEPEVFWYSLDILCSTYTAYLEFITRARLYL